VQRGGLVFYGGFIGATLAGLWFARRKMIPAARLADILAPSIALGNVFGRIGCLLFGCCYGRTCDLPWGIRFPAGSLAQRQHFLYGLAGENAPSLPVHPVQLYDAALNLLLYIALAALYRRKRFDGQVFAAFLIGYAVTRSLAEMFRGDYSGAHRHGGFTPAQLVSAGIFAAGLGLWFALAKRRAPNAS
jgi:phosphatidylglycerol:prolipoprotein diacylglycerol transferase